MKRKSAKKLGKALLPVLSLCSGLFAVAALFVLSACVKASAEDKILSADATASVKADCILVLGAGVYSDSSPCWRTGSPKAWRCMKTAPPTGFS